MLCQWSSSVVINFTTARSKKTVLARHSYTPAVIQYAATKLVLFYIFAILNKSSEELLRMLLCKDFIVSPTEEKDELKY